MNTFRDEKLTTPKEYDIKYKTFLKMRADRIPLTRIAESLSVNISTIHKWRKYGTRKPNLTKQPSQEQKDRALELLESGLSYSKVTEMTGIARVLLPKLFPGMGHEWVPPRSKEVLDRAHEILEEGNTYLATRKETGISQKTLKRHFPGMGKNGTKWYADMDYGLDEYI